MKKYNIAPNEMRVKIIDMAMNQGFLVLCRTKEEKNMLIHEQSH